MKPNTFPGPARGAATPDHTLGVVTLVMTFALVLMGALVTNNEAGDSVPDWPLAYGQVVPIGHLSGKVVFEYSHRVIAGLVAICTLALAILVLTRDRRPGAKALAGSALLVVVVQALLGGIRVRLGETHSFAVATLHAFTAQVFLGTVSAVVMILAPRWRAAETGDVNRTGGLVPLGFATVAAILLQDLLGAGFRHRVFGVLPHALDAVLVVVLVALLAVAIRRRSHQGRGGAAGRVQVASRLAVITVAAQLVVGVASYLLLRRADASTGVAAATVIVAVVHLGLGSALLFESVACAFWTLRLRTM